MIYLIKYEEFLEDFMEFIEEIDNEILIRGYDLTKLQDSLEKAEHEA